jgi:pimeloyl-ACP methyl ester carboxylesterase
MSASVSHSVIAGADVTGADVTGADVTGADVTGADVTGADVTGADVTGADVTGAEVTERLRLTLHGRSMSYLENGAEARPVVVLVHGLASDADTWRAVMSALGPDVHVLAPDLLGHGHSAMPVGADYSVSAHASRLRDLLDQLGHRRVNLVGHSLGGGVALAFAYQFPERTDTLTLIASGGLGPELGVPLRAACLPGVTIAACAVTAVAPVWLSRAARYGATTLGVVSGPDLDGVRNALRSLRTRGALRAFRSTLRCVATWSGQCLDATDRLYLLAGLPILLIAGRTDRCIPLGHSENAHRALPGSRLEVLEAGHFPHTEHPDRIARLIHALLADSGRPPASGGKPRAVVA